MLEKRVDELNIPSYGFFPEQNLVVVAVRDNEQL